MEKKWIIGLCLIVLVIGIAGIAVLLQPSGANQKNIAYEPPVGQLQSTSGEVLGGQSTSKIVLNTAMMKSPDHVTLYKTIPPKVTKADAIAFAKKFNMTDFSESNEGLSIGGDTVVSVSSNDMRYNVMLSSNGGQDFSDSQRVDNPNGVDILENLPSDNDAEKIATTFLKERGLFPEGAVFGGTMHNKAYGSNQSGGAPVVTWEDILVGYTREINGMKVEGTQFMVEIGAHGDVISFFANWKNYEPAGDYPIKSGEAAFEELKQKGATAVNAGPNKLDSVSINQAYLAYHTTALAYHEDYLEPVWVFKGNGMINGKSVGSVQEYIPALASKPDIDLSSKPAAKTST
jgi:hypothetical protein